MEPTCGPHEFWVLFQRSLKTSILVHVSLYGFLTQYCVLEHRYNEVIMSAMAYHINSVSILCSTICSCKDQGKHQSSAPLAFGESTDYWNNAYVILENAFSMWASERVSEWVSGWVSERASDWVTEWVGELLSEWLSEWLSDWMREWVGGRLNEWVSHQYYITREANRQKAYMASTCYSWFYIVSSHEFLL